jgi:hypothetical protein
MEQSIDDEAAKASVDSSIARSRSACPSARPSTRPVLQVRLVLGEDSGEPRLYVADGLDPDDVYLVRPPEHS